MPIELTSIPPLINSVSSDIIFTLEAQPVDLNIAVGSATPFGLAIAEFQLTGGGALPSIFVGQMIFCDDASSPYYGTHVITEIVSTTITSIFAVINTAFTIAYASGSGLVANALDIVDDVFEVREILVDSGVEVPLDIFARVKFNIRNASLIHLNLSEYVRSLFLGGKTTTIIKIYHPLLTSSLQYPTTVVNSTLSTAEIGLHYVDGTNITPQIMESANTLVFFKGYRTIWQENLTHSVFSGDELYGDSTYDLIYAAGSFTGNKTASQKVEELGGCFKDPLNILYINSFGALRNYVVFNDIEQSLSFDNETRFKDDRLNEKILAVQSFTEYNVHSTDVRLTHAESIAQMIASPKAWLMTNDTLTPIVIEKKSFLQYRSFEAYLNFSFKFRFASTIQSQIN
jgi:hypothetical protein